MGREHRAVLLLAGAVALAYLNAFAGAFQFDDYNVIVNNPAVQSWDAWIGDMPGIRPLLKLSYLFNWTSGLGSTGFHLVNLVCHIGNALMVYALARRWTATRTTGQPPEQIAWLAALLFALHPAHTEAVTYISGRSVSLMAVFYLGSMLTYLRGMECSNRLLSHVLSPALFAAALLVKETAWTLPFALFLWGLAQEPSAWRQNLRRLGMHWGVLVGVLALMLSMQGYRRLLVVSLATRSPWDNLLVQAEGVFYLITQPLLLLQLNIDPDLPAITEPNLAAIAKAAGLLALIGGGFAALRRHPWLGLSILWFFLHLLPTNSLLARLDVANDRQLYLAGIGPALIASVALHRVLAEPRALIAGLALAFVLTTATVIRNTDYRSEIALWEATVQDSPNKARAWNNLGYAHQVAGNAATARSAYLRALTLDPQHIRARFNLESLAKHRENP